MNQPPNSIAPPTSADPKPKRKVSMLIPAIPVIGGLVLVVVGNVFTVTRNEDLGVFIRTIGFLAAISGLATFLIMSIVVRQSNRAPKKTRQPSGVVPILSVGPNTGPGTNPHQFSSHGQHPMASYQLPPPAPYGLQIAICYIGIGFGVVYAATHMFQIIRFASMLSGNRGMGMGRGAGMMMLQAVIGLSQPLSLCLLFWLVSDIFRKLGRSQQWVNPQPVGYQPTYYPPQTPTNPMASDE